MHFHVMCNVLISIVQSKQQFFCSSFVCIMKTLMYYETYWASFHILWLWLGSFVMYLTHCFPVRYVPSLLRIVVLFPLLHIEYKFSVCVLLNQHVLCCLRYCDVMHRCALHLGRWHRLIMPHSNVK